ncbi:MAG: hypothetical protein LBQ88_21335 [Treponema sp.]|jgi:Flp pilus assembly protein TadB|nr:hypothetical protein [Treponema sp.]
MAKEIKSISVAPAAEEDTINLWQTFGWELKTTQEVKNKDSHLEKRGDDLVSVTETEHYVKLTFERDPTRQNYAALKSLEEQFYAARHPGIPPKRFGTLWLILIVALLLFGLMLVTTSAIGVLLGLIVAALDVFIIVMRIKSYPKRLQPWTDAYNAYEKTRSEALEQAKSLA